MSRLIKLFLILILAFFFFTATGSASQQTKILNGNNSPAKPWMVSLVSKQGQSYWNHFCGGVLIRPRLVLTAAHCLINILPRELDSIIGRGNLLKKTGERIAASKIYYPQGMVNKFPVPDPDLALILLAKRSKNKPISIYQGEVPLNQTVWGFGWGATENGFPSILQTVDLTTKENDLCQRAYGSQWFNSETMLCASGDVKDTCQGDSGGPLVFNNQVFAITSYGGECGKTLGVYANVFSSLGWINSIIKNPGIGPAFKSGPDSFSRPKPVATSFVEYSPSNSKYLTFNVYSDYRILEASVYIKTSKPETICDPNNSSCFLTNTWLNSKISLGKRAASTRIDFKEGAYCLTAQHKLKVDVFGRQITLFENSRECLS
jgi:trypsin